MIEIDDSKPLHVDTNLDPKGYDDSLIQDVPIPHILTESTTMTRATTNLELLCPPNVYLAQSNVLSEAHHFNLTLSQLLRECNIPTTTLQPGQTVLLPTFYGNYNFGHWFLMVLLHDNNGTNGYILDSLGHLNRQLAFVDNIF